MDLLLFLPDADGKDRADEFGVLEAAARNKGVKLLCCAGVQEIEVWCLAGHRDKLSQSWADIRQDVTVKESVFVPFLARHGDARRAGGGRDVLMNETLKNYPALLQFCPELTELQRRIREVMS
jgi:hypothetical protein